MDIVFVILHYNSFAESKQCVKSIRENIDTTDYAIIIIDNCSTDSSWGELNQEYSYDEDIILIHNEINLGYAKGNNVGYRYAKERLSPKFIIQMNSDLYLIQKHFYNNINILFDMYKYAVMGPMIATGDGNITSNPVGRHIMTIPEAKKSVRGYSRLLFLNRFKLDKVYTSVMSRIHRYKPPFTIEERIVDQCDVVLHGSIWIFSQIYINEFDGLDESTFLYGEEEILFLHIMEKGLHTLYSPKIVVFHKEDSSVNSSFSNSAKKNKFIYKNSIDSYQSYCNLVEHFQIKLEKEEK